MELGNVVIGALAITACALPFVMINMSKKNREKVYLHSLTQMATQFNAQINHHETFGGFAIGIDEIKNLVFYYRQSASDKVEQTVQLNEIQSCKVINTCRTIKTKEGKQRVIDKLEMNFTPILKSKPEVKMEFFNSDISLQLYDELQSIERWSQLINQRLKNKN